MFIGFLKKTGIKIEIYKLFLNTDLIQKTFLSKEAINYVFIFKFLNS